MGDDVAYLAEHDPKHLLPIVILVQDLGCVDAECRGYPWAKYDLIGEDMFAITRHYPQPSPQAVADLVGKYHLRGQLLDMVAGEFNWPVDFDDGLKARVVTERVIPVLAAASRKADAAEIRALVRRGKGLAGSDDNVEIAIARLAVTLDPDHATDILLEQLDRNRGLAQLTSDLLKVDGVQHWGVIKSSYQKNLEKGGLIIETLATLKPAEAAPKLAELLEASPDGLAITLDHEDMPTDDDGTRDMLFDAFVKAAQAVNHGQPVLDAATATAARLEWRGKGSDPQAVAAHNRAAIAARPVAVAKLLAFFRVP